MNTELVKQTHKNNPDQFEHIVEELRSLIVEAHFASAWVLIEGYHELGRLLIEYDLSDGASLGRLAPELKRSKITLYKAVQFYRMFPDLNDLPEGKNLSWYKIVNKYLSGRTDENEEYTMPDYKVLQDYIKNNFEILADRAELLKTGIKLFIPHEKIKDYEIQKRTDN